MPILDVTALLNDCNRNTDQFLRGKASKVESCYQLIQLAFGSQDEVVWQACYSMLARRVQRALASHSLMSQVDEDIEYFINPCIARFWAAIRLKHDQFDSAQSYFKYLRMCVHAELIDYWRKREETDDREDVVDPSSSSNNCTADEIMAIVYSVVEAPELQLLCELYYRYEMKPGEIHSKYSMIWPTVKKVYYHVYELNKRLRQNPDLLDCLGKIR